MYHIMGRDDVNTTEHRQRQSTADFPEEQERMFETMFETLFETLFKTSVETLLETMHILCGRVYSLSLAQTDPGNVATISGSSKCPLGMATVWRNRALKCEFVQRVPPGRSHFMLRARAPMRGSP